MKVAEQIRARLTEALAPLELEIVDQSHLHAGHAGAPEGGESHFRIRVVSAEFTGKTRVARQRLVNSILAAELAGPVHALSMDLQAPEA
ncbi:MAG: BolA family transcriptional regulator [Aquisalinus sp.]|nr:BolA family transcriptional regulator [Aquisalinus sp.]